MAGKLRNEPSLILPGRTEELTILFVFFCDVGVSDLTSVKAGREMNRQGLKDRRHNRANREKRKE